jgi:hypothetical protein
MNRLAAKDENNSLATSMVLISSHQIGLDRRGTVAKVKRTFSKGAELGKEYGGVVL